MKNDISYFLNSLQLIGRNSASQQHWTLFVQNFWTHPAFDNSLMFCIAGCAYFRKKEVRPTMHFIF